MATMIGSQAVIEDTNARSLAFYCTSSTSHVDHEVIRSLQLRSAAQGNRNARICLHNSPQAPFHDMVIIEYQNSYCRPHKHLEKGETTHIIEGRVLMIILDDLGGIESSYVLGRDETLLCRIDANQWHTIVPLTNYSIYHESKPGPYLGAEDSIFPSWAPDGSNVDGALLYRNNLLRQVGIKA